MASGLEGRTIGPYQLMGELGRGAMGMVFRARDLRANREVALKSVGSELFSRLGLKRFQQEAQAVAKLRHPGIVAIHDLSEHEGRPFMVMELIEGGSLQTRLDRQGPLSPEESAAMTRSLAEAVHYAHGQGVLHRDLKPSNVLLREDGVPVVSDFGLAKDLSASREALTLSGQMVGTPGYLAPEQARGSLDQIGTCVDVYGLGGLLYAMLSGGPPFRARGEAELLRAVLNEPPRRLGADRPEVPADLEAVCFKCLAKRPSDRYASAADLAADLGRFLGGEAVQAAPARRGPSRRTVLLAGSLLGALGLIGGVTALAMSIVPDRAELEAARLPPKISPPPPPPHPRALSASQIRDGDRRWRSVKRLDDSQERLTAARSWLDDYPTHPQAKEASALVEGLERQFPLAVLDVQDVLQASRPDSRFDDRRANPLLVWTHATEAWAVGRLGDLFTWDLSKRPPPLMSTRRLATRVYCATSTPEGAVLGGRSLLFLPGAAQVAGSRGATVGALATSPDGRSLAVAWYEGEWRGSTRQGSSRLSAGRIQLLDLKTRKPRWTAQPPPGMPFGVLLFDPKGERVFAFRQPSSGFATQLPRPDSGLLTLAANNGAPDPEQGLTFGVHAAALAEPGTVVVSQMGSLVQLDLATGEPKARFSVAHDLFDPSAAPAPAMREGRAVGLVSARSGAVVYALRGVYGDSMRRSTPGYVLRSWDVRTHEARYVTRREGAYPASLALSADEQLLLVGTSGGRVEVWRAH